MYTEIVGCNMVKAIVDVVENMSVDAEGEAEADFAECQIVDITKVSRDVEETTP